MTVLSWCQLAKTSPHMLFCGQALRLSGPRRMSVAASQMLANTLIRKHGLTQSPRSPCDSPIGVCQTSTRHHFLTQYSRVCWVVRLEGQLCLCCSPDLPQSPFPSWVPHKAGLAPCHSAGGWEQCSQVWTCCLRKGACQALCFFPGSRRYTMQQFALYLYWCGRTLNICWFYLLPSGVHTSYQSFRHIAIHSLLIQFS